ncbi:hypothetical protein AAFF_G00133540 [Aldrovandia affinis]|uniref:Uncharacterized protein n=1 Tax=Aldrovandia affinis TaxID=143900 RepID=A0AAD7RQD0_9TELE|nr:hypothetical protein AAFF_G00133540 [Aldrovandia affinis]
MPLHINNRPLTGRRVRTPRGHAGTSPAGAASERARRVRASDTSLWQWGSDHPAREFRTKDADGTNTEASGGGPHLSTSDARSGPSRFEPRGGGALSALDPARLGWMACLVYVTVASSLCTLPVCQRKLRSP